MHLRNGDHGYGVVTLSLHWLTFAALVCQLTLGYLIDDSGHGRGRGRGRGDGSGHGSGHGRGGELDLDDPVTRAHIILGITILVLAAARLGWRLATPLPPWSDRLSSSDRLVQNAVELILIFLLFATPLTGLALVLVDDDLLVLHVACQISLYVAFAVHVFVALRRRTVGRMLTVAP